MVGGQAVVGGACACVYLCMCVLYIMQSCVYLYLCINCLFIQKHDSMQWQGQDANVH